MDFLNKAFAQVAELFRTMSPGARITTALLLALVVISIGYLFNHQISSGDSYLLDGQHFSAAELQAMQAAFGQAGLSNYEMEGSRIRVPGALKAKYMAALADGDAMPSHFGSHLDAAVNKPSPFTSKSQQEAMLKNAKQKELASIIRWMSGIESSAVIYDSQKKPGLGGEQVVTASVTVKPVGSKPLPAAQVRKIRDLVTTAIVGLSPANVTLVDVNGPSYRGGGGGDLPDALDDPYMQRVKSWQEIWEQKIHHALEYVPGVVVTANVELDTHTKLLEEKTHIENKPVSLVVSEEIETNQSETANPSGQPGFQAQQRPNAPATLPAQSRGSHNDKERTSRKEQNDAPRNWTKTETAPLTPKRVTVTVGVPTSYFEQLYREQIPAPPDQPAPPLDKKVLDQIQTEEIAKIQKHIMSLVPQSDLTADPRPLVTVTPFRPLATGEVVEPPTSQIAVSWLATNWSSVAMAGLAMFSLVMLRSMARPALAPPAAPALPPPPPPAPEKESDAKKAEPEKHGSRLKRRLGSGQSLRDELAEMVREDPDTAANILRSWISNAT